MGCAILRLAAGGVFVISGSRIKRFADPACSARRQRKLNHNVSSSVLSAPNSGLEGSVRLALRRVASLIVRDSVRIGFAVSPGLTTRMDDGGLVEIIQDLLITTFPGNATGRLLLTAVAQGDHIDIALSDDMSKIDRACWTSQVRGLQERVATLGAALHINVHTDGRTTIAIRLPSSNACVAATKPVRGPEPGEVHAPGWREAQTADPASSDTTH